MADWENLRFALAVGREHSLSSAARGLGVSHSTVARRVTTLERRLGARLFDPSSDGYALTALGETLLTSLERVDDEIIAMERALAGADARLSGKLRVTAPPCVLRYVLMPLVARFLEAQPNIELEIIADDEPLDLTRRQADIAFRFTNQPPEDVIAKRLATVRYAAYASGELLAARDADGATTFPVLVYLGQDSGQTQPSWLKRFSRARVRACFDSAATMVEACKAGVGAAELACAVGDSEPSLRRLDGAPSNETLGLWLLIHPDLRATARVRAFRDHMAQAIEGVRGLLEGNASGGLTPGADTPARG